MKNRAYVFQITTPDVTICLSTDEQRNLDIFVFFLHMQMKLKDQIRGEFFVLTIFNEEAYLTFMSQSFIRPSKMVFFILLFIYFNVQSKTRETLVPFYNVFGIMQSSTWLGIEPGTSCTRSQHSTARLSRRRFVSEWVWLFGASDLLSCHLQVPTPLKAPVVSSSKKFNPYCSIPVDSRNEFKRDFTIKLK